MSDSRKKYEEMVENGEISKDKFSKLKDIWELYKEPCMKYVWVLDFNDGKVYRYDISSLGNESNDWNPDHESCEAFLCGAGHRIKDCEWMITDSKFTETPNLQ